MTIDELEAEIRHLSDADFNQLAHRLGFTVPSRMQWGRVEIDDGGKTPIAIIEYADGSKQKIDIFAAIKKNILSIGNPIILIAIQHWYEILRHRSALTFGDAWDDQEVIRSIKELFQTGHLAKSSNSLARIGKTIIDAAKARAVSKEAALVAWVKHEGFDRKDTLLYKAFEFLRENKARNDAQRLKELEVALQEARVSNGRIHIDRLMSFLRSEQGNRYLHPKRWDAMRNAFIAWHFHLRQSSVVRQFSKARTKNNTDNEVNTRYFYPRYNTYQLPDLDVLRRAMLVPAEACLKEDEDKQERETHPANGNTAE